MQRLNYGRLPLRGRTAGFTVIELMITVAIMAILTAIAVPSYSSYIAQSRAKGASADLAALSLVYENDFQKTLVYPTYAAATAIPALPGARTGTQITDFGAWSPAEGSYYSYSVSSSGTTYTVTAALTANAANCTLTLTAGNVRTAAGPNCGFTSW